MKGCPFGSHARFHPLNLPSLMAEFSNLDELVAVYPKYFNPAAAEGMDAIVQLDISGDKGGQYFIQIADQEIDVQEGMHDDPSVTVKTAAEHWLGIHRGDANPMSLMMTGKLKISGSMGVATKFQNLFDVGG